VLERGPVLPAPPVPVVRAPAGGSPEAVHDALAGELRDRGLAVVQLDEPLSSERFAALGSLLGTPMPERDPAVLPHVEREVVLNLVSEHGHITDVALQPFATTFLTLHTESSARRPEDQPRYIVLMCCEPGDAATEAQTVLVPMAAVERRLTEDEIGVLSRTRYRISGDPPAIVRGVGGRRVFSFRDYLPNPLEWTYAGDDHGEQGVNDAVRGLLASMYAANTASGLLWARGTLVVIDNTFYFHGRSAGAPAASAQHRHLKRLRIVGG